MNVDRATEARVAALEEGRAFADRSSFPKASVEGGDAERWLEDLITAGMAGLSEGRATRSLLLTPTGRVRADFHVIRRPGSFLLIQHPTHPASIRELLAPYVLSSDVELRDVTRELALFCLPGRIEGVDELPRSSPSMLGDGLDVVTGAGAAADDARASLRAALFEVGEDAVELWRIRRGVARFPVDVGEDSVPAEAGLEHIIDFTKGCFLGQESVAKVKNLGHPTWVVVALRAEAPIRAGEAVLAGGEEVGRVTSAAPAPGGTALIARVRWDARSARLETASAARLRPV